MIPIKRAFANRAAMLTELEKVDEATRHSGNRSLMQLPFDADKMCFWPTEQP